MLVASKKTKYLHKIKITVNKIEYIMITSYDVCIGDFCKVRLGRKEHMAQVENAIRYSGSAIIDPRIIKIYFELNENDLRDTNNTYKFLYNVKLQNIDRKTEYSNFVSDVNLPIGTIVVSKYNYGIIKEVSSEKEGTYTDKVIKAFKLHKEDSIYKVFSSDIVPRYLLNEIYTVYSLCDENPIEKEKRRDILFKKLTIEDNYNFDYSEYENIVYLTNLARLGDKKAMAILVDYFDRQEQQDEFEYWFKKLMMDND